MMDGLFDKLTALRLALILLAPTLAHAQTVNFPEPDPPVLGPAKAEGKALEPKALADPSAVPIMEWQLHKSDDGTHPSAGEQQLLWLMNRARTNPTTEGIFLATTGDTRVQQAISFFAVDLNLMQSYLAAYPARPPSAFDIRMYNGSEAHSQQLITDGAQHHIGQFDRIDAAGFTCNGGRASVFSFSESPLHAHAGLNIDWGGTAETSGMQSPPGHRYAIMGGTPTAADTYPNVGLALVPETNPSTSIGPLVFSGAYCAARTSEPDHFNMFLVGTVWADQNGDNFYDEGEGLSGVSVVPDSGTYYAQTGIAGGFAIPISVSTTYTVTFSGGDMGDAVYTKITTVTGSSVLVDLNTAANDVDLDGIDDGNDNCPGSANADQLDSDEDGAGDACDMDDDDDGVADTQETEDGTDPLDPDSDDDGLDDGQEAGLGTDPLEVDSDGDQHSDKEEVDAGSDPLAASDHPTSPGLNIILIKAAIDAQNR
jgi:hypothetical protein